MSPDPVLTQHERDYRWLTQVYESVRPSTGTGRLLWHALGPKTIVLIHEHVHVDAIRDDLDTLVLDAGLLEAVLGTPDPGKKSKEVEIKISRWLRKRLHDPRFKELGERLEELGRAVDALGVLAEATTGVDGLQDAIAGVAARVDEAGATVSRVEELAVAIAETRAEVEALQVLP